MTTVRTVLGKSTVTGIVALLLVGTACALALQGKFEDAKGFAVLATIPVVFLFRAKDAA